MNKKRLLLIAILVLALQGYRLYNRNVGSFLEVLELNTQNGIQITAPIQFKADEKVTAIELKILGDIIKVECLSDDFETILQDNVGCAMANFNGGSDSGVIGKVTFIDNKEKKPTVTSILGNANGDNAKNGLIYIEY